MPSFLLSVQMLISINQQTFDLLCDRLLTVLHCTKTYNAVLLGRLKSMIKTSVVC